MIRAIGDKIVVNKIKKPVQTLSGLILAHQESFEPCIGMVVSSGPSARIPVGKKVYFSRLAGQHIGGQTILKTSEVLAYE